MCRLKLSLFLLLISITSCNDHLLIESNNLPQGYADSQVVGSWKITAFTSDGPYDWDGNGSAETNIYNTWSACEKDNLYTFVGDKTGTFKTTCSNTEPGTWKIVDTKDLVYILANSGYQSEKFISMTANEFKTTIRVTTITSENFTLTKTWVRQ